jgi:molybdopterin-biosynthesis enzyme MoeA-like protein
MNDSRLRMAKFPENCELIDNPLTAAPGCKIENVYVLAGIPSIMQVMFDYASQSFVKGRKIYSKTISCDLIEGNIAKELTDIQKKNVDTEIGSYPYVHLGRYAVSLVVRSMNRESVNRASDQISKMIIALGGNFLN